jgi:RNA polymerase sigma-70 factor (ECF subfamily)
MTESDDRENDIYVLNDDSPSTNEEPSGSRKSSTAQTSDGIVTDHQLLSAYAHGDELAFETLVEKYFRMVYTVAARQTGDWHLAEEIAQSVFLILSRKARGFSAKASIPGWLLRTTRFVCRDAIKMRIRRKQNEQRLAVTLEQQLEIKQDTSTMEVLLDEAIQALQPHEQAGIVARFFEGKNFQQIAQMFAITEDAARKRTSRCLAKLQSFMERRGARVSSQTLSGLLVAPLAHQPTQEALQLAIHTAHGVWKGSVAAENAITLAHHAARHLQWRLLARWSLRSVMAILLIFLVFLGSRQWNQPASVRIEKLGKAWGALDQRVARHRQFLIQTPPNTPNYQATVQAELGAISRESSRIIAELNPLLALSEQRVRLASFLTAELSSTLNLDFSQKTRLLIYLESRLAQGTTFQEAMKAVAETSQTEAAEIKAILSPAQQQLFDQIYGPDGVLLFSYPKAVALGKIGP